jgi:metal-responsive CopG/Arc/MetJ family transcriptional regulator
MASTKRRPAAKAAPQPEAEGKQKVTVWLSPEMMGEIAEIRRRAGFGSRAEIMREAMVLGFRQILARYER